MFRKVTSMRVVGRLLSRAETIAHEMGDELPGAEHLVLAAIELPDGSADAVMRSFGVDSGALRTAVITVHERALDTVGIPHYVPSEPPAHRPPAIYRSAGSARTLMDASRSAFRAYPADTLLGAHVLVAASEMEQGTLSRAFSEVGVDRALLRTRAIDAIRMTGR